MRLQELPKDATLKEKLNIKLPYMTQIKNNDMLNNIALWFSSKRDEEFICWCGEKEDGVLLKLTSFNYNLARYTIEKYIAEQGKLVNITYNHKDDSYSIWVEDIKDEERFIYEYKLASCKGRTIEI